ncbi:hypothetical protein HY947_00820 [Candidatus Gottesmanbacteria bacterium]|nr:hypothetical protein [Candidatus Gottesmanbacteria bacterium]
MQIYNVPTKNLSIIPVLRLLSPEAYVASNATGTFDSVGHASKGREYGIDPLISS